MADPTLLESSPKLEVDGAGSSVSYTFTTPPSVGEYVIVTATAYTASGDLSVSDNQGHTYARPSASGKAAPSPGIGGSSNNIADLWLVKVTTSSAPFIVTVSFPGGSYLVAHVASWNNLAASSVAVDYNENSGGANTSSLNTGNVTTVNTNDLVISVMCSNSFASPNTLTPPTGFTSLFASTNYFSYEQGSADYKIASGTLSATYGYSPNEGAGMTALIIVLKSDAGGAGTTYSVAVAEGTATAADTLSGSVVYSSVVAEGTATAVATTSAAISAVSYDAAVAESGAAADTTSAAIVASTYSVAVDEFGSAVATSSVSATLNAAVAESGIAADSVSTGIIVISTAVGTSTHPSSYASGGTIYLLPRLTSAEGGGYAWINVVAKVSGVSGMRPYWDVQLAVAASEWIWEGGNEPGYFSEDGGITWYAGIAPDYGSDPGHVILRAPSAFTSDVVWFGRFARECTTQTSAWIAALAAAYPTRIQNLTGGSGFIVDTYSAQTDELSRTVPATNLYGFWLRSGSGGKQVIALLGGVHASEDFGSTCYRKAVDFIAAQSTTEMQALLTRFDFLCLPYLNAPGRDGGHHRGQFQGGSANDLNRHFRDYPSGLEVVTKPRAVLDANFNNVAGFLDLHGGSGVLNGCAWWFGTDGSGHPPLNTSFGAAFNLRMAANGESASNVGSEIDSINCYTTSYGWFDKASPLSITVEFNHSFSKSDTDSTNRGRAVVYALYDRMVAGDWGAAPISAIVIEAGSATDLVDSVLIPHPPVTGAVAETGSAADTPSAEVLMYAYPNGDIVANGWLGHDPLFAGTSLYPKISENPADFTNYIYSPTNPATQQFEVTLDPLGDPSSSTNHGINLGLRATGLDTNFDFNLVQGTTILDSWTENVLVAQGNVIRTRLFSAAVANSITNYADLRLRGVAHA